jgi:hypothetical protein
VLSRCSGALTPRFLLLLPIAASLVVES